MHDEENARIAERLSLPATKRDKAAKIVTLVRENYNAIYAASRKSRHDGKTWDEIAHDLSPNGALKGSTVGRTFARVMAERHPGVKKPSPTNGDSRAGSPLIVDTTPIQAEAQADAPALVRPSLFGRQVDPIRDLQNRSN